MILILEGAIGCNLNCKYCYQRSLREYGFPPYDLDKVMDTVRRLYNKDNEPIVLHGGEPLTLPFKDIERILKESYELQGYSTINTNGTLIDDNFIELFKRYKTRIALSVDGFYPLNKLRGYPDDENKCKEYTGNLVKTIEKLCSENICVNLMVVLHRENAVGERLKQLGEFLINMRKLGISAKLNPCRLYVGQLTPEELFNAWRYIARVSLVTGAGYDPVSSFLSNLWGETPLNDCYMSICDPFHTDRALRIIGDGRVVNCSCADSVRGITLQTEEPSYERYMALQKIPISDGGCSGCKYWNICYGGCPSQDVRLRDIYCLAYYKIYDYLESNIRSFEPVFKEKFKLAVDSKPKVIEDKPVHRIIERLFPSNVRFKKTVINGITQIEYGNKIEVVYNG